MFRAILLATAMAAMAVGIYGGLVRLGFAFWFGPELALSHGPIMVCGLFGTLIALERAVAMARPWPLLAPALFAVGVVGMVAGAPAIIPGVLFVGGAAVLTVATLAIFRQQPALFTLALGVGASALLIGNLLWALGAEIADLAGWWIGFLVCTIAAERLELSRILRPPKAAQPAFVAAVGLLLLGAAFGLASDIGRAIMGVALVATALWLARYDIARTTIRRPGATRFFAVAMLAGYFWLAVAGVLLLAGAGLSLQYDLALHAVFIGFVLSMVFGHALIILPAVTGIKLGYRGGLYAPLALLHLSVILRVAGGVFGSEPVRVLSGPLTAVSLMVFASVVVSVVRRRPPVRAIRPSPGG